MKKYQNLLSENFPSLIVKFSIYLNKRVFVMFDANTLRQLFFFLMCIRFDRSLFTKLASHAGSTKVTWYVR